MNGLMDSRMDGRTDLGRLSYKHKLISVNRKCWCGSCVPFCHKISVKHFIISSRATRNRQSDDDDEWKWNMDPMLDKLLRYVWVKCIARNASVLKQCVTHIVTLELYVQHPSVHPSSGRNAILLSAIENKFLNIAKIYEIKI